MELSLKSVAILNDIEASVFQFSRDISGLFILVQFYPLFQKIRILSVPGRVQSKIIMARSFSLGWSSREGNSKISDLPLEENYLSDYLPNYCNSRKQ